VLVARFDRGAIGCLTITDEKHPLELCHKLAYIASIYVKPQFRNKGGGKALLSKAIGQASDRGYEQVILRVATKNDSAVTL
jgi:ribosomal protein S18 acetylase RimI-like enzyme